MREAIHMHAGFIRCEWILFTADAYSSSNESAHWC